MGVVKTIRGEDGKPYISLEDFIKEVKEVKKNTIVDVDRPTFIDVVLKTLIQMEEEYYNKYLFKKNDDS
jgi:hypothetical protein